MIIFDDAVVVGIDPDNNSIGAMVHHSEAVLRVAVDLYEHYWQRGRSLTQSPVHSDSDLSMQEKELLRLLVQGATDEQVGRKLGVSLRTVRRMAAKLSEQVGASGRFELGVRAAQRGGWISPSPRLGLWGGVGSAKGLLQGVGERNGCAARGSRLRKSNRSTTGRTTAPGGRARPLAGSGQVCGPTLGNYLHKQSPTCTGRVPASPSAALGKLLASGRQIVSPKASAVRVQTVSAVDSWLGPRAARQVPVRSRRSPQHQALPAVPTHPSPPDTARSVGCWPGLVVWWVRRF
ncbi:helix-turn-helix transcriptional regulator [Kribbella speibonae]